MLRRGFSYGGGVTPGGLDTYVQYNSAGALGGDIGFTYNATNKTLDIGGGTVDANDPILNLTQVWNNGAIAFDAISIDVTNTASAATAALFNAKVGGVSVFRVQKDGLARFTSVQSLSGPVNVYTSGGGAVVSLNEPIGVTANGGLAWATSTNDPTTAKDLYLRRGGAGILSQYNGANAQGYYIYNTYTDASNNERTELAWQSNAFNINVTESGTGAQRGMNLRLGGTSYLSLINGLGVNIPQSLYGWYYYAISATGPNLTFTSGAFYATVYIWDKIADENYTMATTAQVGGTAWAKFMLADSKTSYGRVTANAGQKIRLAGGTSAIAGYVRSNTSGAYLSLIFNPVSQVWIAESQIGTWTIDS